ncbi:hypothetical protein [Pseudomonas mediterranea]|uniref:hypothetical protein n=1 Tax=Pseudomonas mediterranea TaxID=183795 RepID=UPI001DFAA760|nr:hypothetical protein [Pseudomonas mediterranea]CAH0152836.1 hypothetical protein SRABI112_00733 [Pseudomonas mediterranea]
MPYVQRDEAGIVIGKFANAQPGCAEEWLDESSPELAPKGPTEEEVNQARLRAYANPVTGSDRYIAEAYAERAAGNEESAKEIDAKMVRRRIEIKLQHPWPQDSQ